VGGPASLVGEDVVVGSGTFGDDPEDHLKAARGFADAGHDEVCIHQIGPGQRQFFDFYRTRVLPALSGG
jgi:hypothetical protein